MFSKCYLSYGITFTFKFFSPLLPQYCFRGIFHAVEKTSRRRLGELQAINNKREAGELQANEPVKHQSERASGSALSDVRLNLSEARFCLISAIYYISSLEEICGKEKTF